MLYKNKTFTLPATRKRMTDVAYEIAVGVRCTKCKKKTEKCGCKK